MHPHEVSHGITADLQLVFEGQSRSTVDYGSFNGHPRHGGMPYRVCTLWHYDHISSLKHECKHGCYWHDKLSRCLIGACREAVKYSWWILKVDKL